ncbi:hypothetical protein JTE90_011971 [Oedothorax gibbosus]|uniref:TBC domain-containing protein kinase-like protein n=1 Tax=Oedothorax gibbosus TaxID=931172 RepID=A0AAV6U4I8_9ARAC|nr:hypothetical protein JTE90_011971 [Oedothorax gibbosus]
MIAVDISFQQKMSSKNNSPILGAWTYFASAHAIDVCGINGLPLTPNSIRILGRFQKLKLLKHPHLCSYLDIQRGKHERVMIVCEHYPNNLLTPDVRSELKSAKALANLTFQILDVLSYLHRHGIVHRFISPQNIRFDYERQIKISNYGLYYMTEGGSTVSFPIGIPKYMAPEVLAHGLPVCSSSSKCDIWSLGMILLELIMDISLWDGLPLEEILKEIISLLHFDNGHDVVCSIIKKNSPSFKIQSVSDNLMSFIGQCLNPISKNRKEACQMFASPLFEEFKLTEKSRADVASSLFLSTQLRCFESWNNYKDIGDHLSKRPLQELYYLWQLAGGDLEAELRRQELIKAKPPIVTMSKIVSGEGEEFGHEKDRAYLLDDSVLVLPLEPLRHRLRDVDYDVYYPLIEYSLNGLSTSTFFTTVQETAKLPLVIKEKDVEYQLHRIVLFKRLIECYPYKRAQIIQEAKLDIPPLYRSWVWATLLEIEGNVEEAYDSIDKETPTPTDRQIEVDIPRCHQYDELLSSPAGHKKFKRILKAWVVSHPQYVYWQGLDSLCAPFLSLNFNDEALAYSCLSSFISKYLHNFFLKDNSAVIQEYLAKFSHLIAFHDPDLTNHLDSIGFIPELYAIPWFLTMYTHVFPLHKIFHLWDTLLLGHSSFPLCIGVAILKQLRNNLLSYGFNECILMFSDMPEIDIQRCVQDSIKIFCSTPKSITYRKHEKVNQKLKQAFESNRRHTGEKSVDLNLVMEPLPIAELKSEVCPRISAEDLVELLDLSPDSKNKTRSQSIKIVVIDIRSNEEYNNGALQRSLNIPYATAFTQDGLLDASVNFCSKGKIITVIGNSQDYSASKFATNLVRLGYSYVCTLHGGIELLRKTGFLISKASEN